MKLAVLFWMAAACLPALPVRAQDVDYDDAVSRPVLVVNAELTEAQSEAVSRSVLAVTGLPADSGDAMSRALILVTGKLVDSGDAVSRQVLLNLPPYAALDVRQALRVCAGLLAATRENVDRLNIVRDGASATKVDMRDAARIARMAMGLDR